MIDLAPVRPASTVAAPANPDPAPSTTTRRRKKQPPAKPPARKRLKPTRSVTADEVVDPEPTSEIIIDLTGGITEDVKTQIQQVHSQKHSPTTH
jgi:hypothetical protein